MYAGIDSPNYYPPGYRLEECPGMKKAYKKWELVHDRYMDNCRWPRLGKCGKAKRKRMKALEKQTKKAWAKCQMPKVEMEVKKAPQLRLQAPTAITFRKGMLKAPVVSAHPLYDASTAQAEEQAALDAEMAEMAEMAAIEAAEANKRKMMLYGGIAAGGLVLFLLLRRK